MRTHPSTPIHPDRFRALTLHVILIFAACAFFPFVSRAAVDTDGDGYDDETELANGYDPYGPGRLEDADTDNDGLSNAEELLYKTDMLNFDTDGDGYPDGLEVASGYDPLKPDGAVLKKRIEISLEHQTLTRYIGERPIASYAVSTGRPGMRTPTGTFAIQSKHPRAWSASARLWMPYWMAFIGTKYGIHELPEWPGGHKEGEDHLGTPVSHGCVRLGVGNAEETYEWADVGTMVVIK